MKTNIKLCILLLVSIVLLKCDYQGSQFDFNGSLQGKVTDANGNPLHGDLSNNNLVVKLLGEGDTQPTEIRVDGEGNYKNTKLFPKEHKVWLEGAIVESDTVYLDFGKQPDQKENFTVTPLITPTISGGSASGASSIDVEYSISNEADVTVETREIYCSTVQYPTADIGSRTSKFFTKTVALSDQSGNITIDGLTPGETYYIRIGAMAQQSSFTNYSNQVKVAL